jgi:alpha-ketoglutarate-dependent taurine dioxygenase
MAAIALERLSENVGVEVLDVDVDRLLNDDDLPDACLDALEKHGVLLFRELHAGDEAQVAFCRKLGDLVRFPAYRIPEVMEISFDPSNPNAEYFASNDYWHIDGSLDDIPAKAGVLSAHVVAEVGGETEFASTYAAYDDLTDEEKERYAGMRAIHTFESVQRKSYPDPTPEQRAEWARRPAREHPLVWEHRSGRRSLVFGPTIERFVGMGVEESQELLARITERATAPDKVLRHSWTVGDLVIWDNRGLVHRACEFDRTKPRRMHRTTLAGDEAIK